MTNAAKKRFHETHKVCACCGAKGKMTLDHVRPKCFGGTREWRQALCSTCNKNKGILTMDYNTKTFYLEPWMMNLNKKDQRELLHNTFTFSADYLNPSTKLHKRYHEV